MSGWRRRRTRPQWNDARWIVLDVEASGLDAARDRLLAIAGVALQADDARPRIDLGDSFEAVLRHHDGVADKSNILLHGIGVGAQRRGSEPSPALAAFERWVARSPLIAFHAAFDQTLIGRALREHLGRRIDNPWLDLAHLAEVVRPDLRARSLDEWLQVLGIACADRHRAAADTLATAELLLRLWPDLSRQRARPGFRGLQALAAHRRWLRPS
jgi:DNA polymerase-3 subunit epsilon